MVFVLEKIWVPYLGRDLNIPRLGPCWLIRKPNYHPVIYVPVLSIRNSN